MNADQRGCWRGGTWINKTAPCKRKRLKVKVRPSWSHWSVTKKEISLRPFDQLSLRNQVQDFQRVQIKRRHQKVKAIGNNHIMVGA